LREILCVQKLGKNHGGYHGETIDIRAVLREVEIAAQQHGWTSESFHKAGEFKLFALHRAPISIRNPQSPIRIYLSAGIHGDEPAGPLSVRQLLQEDRWPDNLEIWMCPCLNPAGFILNRRENAEGKDLNRDYRNPQTAEVRAHIAWLERRSGFDLSLCLHEDWETQGFYVYELNPDNRPSLAETMIDRVGKICSVDSSEIIDGRPARNGIIRAGIDPRTRPDWPEAFYLITFKTRLSCTLEAPSDFPLPVRVTALVEAVKAALQDVSNSEVS
jgi:hypothetical protein